jgi:hypothetical protein
VDAERIAKEVAEQVRSVLAEAEQRAAEIVREAREEAERIRAAAESEGRERLDEARRTLEELQGKLSGPRAEVEPGPVVVPEPEPPPEPVPAREPVPEPEPPSIPEPTPPPDEGTPPGGSRNGDLTAARLVAMNMALDGSSRETIERHLADNYSLDDASALVGEILERTAK